MALVVGANIGTALNPLLEEGADRRGRRSAGRGARPEFASADRVDRGLPVTQCTGPSARRLPEGAAEAREPGPIRQSPRVASKLERPQRFFNHLRMLTATSR